MRKRRSVFDLSHEHKLTCDMGKLIPIFCEDVLPGDTFKVKTDIVVRLQALLAPIMHRVDVFTHFFFVPNRLIFDKWEDFITGGEDGTDNTVAPTITADSTNGFAIGSLADYFGIPTGVPSLEVSALPFRAYDLIYNEWYRDENIIPEVNISTAAGADSTTSTTLLSRAWEHDYFTKCLPWTQRGSQVSLPLSGGKVPVRFSSEGGVPYYKSTVTTGSVFPSVYGGKSVVACYSGDGFYNRFGSGESGSNLSQYGTDGLPLEVDLSSIGSSTINNLRQAFKVQQFMEISARGGARYIESILSHFGVKSSDYRLQRPVYLGGGRSPIVISEVLQTSSTSGTQALGDMGGHGFSAQRTHEFTRFFEEHGWIIGIMSIMPRTSYQQGLNRMWSRSTRYEYYWPIFAHLGEQGVLNKEIYAQNPSVVDSSGVSVNEKVFGYLPRYQEYRERESQVHGQMRSTLDFWHMGRIFSSLPELNANFINSDPTKRIEAVTNEDNCLVNIYHNVKAIRPIPKKGVPGGL